MKRGTKAPLSPSVGCISNKHRNTFDITRQRVRTRSNSSTTQKGDIGKGGGNSR